MNKGTFNILNGDNSSVALLVLYRQDIELTTYEKVLLANHWIRQGSPPELEHKLEAMLGEDYNLYLNPFLHKLLNTKLDSLVFKPAPEYNTLATDEYKELMNTVFHKMLQEFEDENTKGGYESHREFVINTEFRKLLSYKISSKIKDYDLIRVELEAMGYEYNVRIFMMGTGEDLSPNLSKHCVTNLKGLMYFMSEDDTWDLSQIERSINFIEFESKILNSLISAMRTLYDRKDETS